MKDSALRQAPICKEGLLPRQRGGQGRDALLQLRVCVDPLLIRLGEGAGIELARKICQLPSVIVACLVAIAAESSCVLAFASIAFSRVVCEVVIAETRVW